MSRGVTEAADILAGMQADIGLLKLALAAKDPYLELKIRVADIEAATKQLAALLAAEPGAAEMVLVPVEPSEAETRAALDAYWQAVENGRGTMSVSFTTNHSMRAALIGSRKYLAAAPHQSGESGNG